MAHSLIAMNLIQQQNTRDELVKQHNTAMFNAIPNVTSAIELMVGLPDGGLSWNEIFITDGILVLEITIKFPITNIPMFVQIFAPKSIENLDDTAETINQIVRLGLPLELVDQPSPVIIEFFRSVALSSLEGDEDEEEVPAEQATQEASPNIMGQHFNTAELTPEQTQALLMFQNQHPSSKH